MATDVTAPAGQDIRVDIAALMTDLLDLSQAKHAAANTTGQGTLNGRSYEGQSHAYANAALWLQAVLDVHAA